MSDQIEKAVVAGVDVGGMKKGFHAVAYRGMELIGKCQSANATEIAEWCRNVGALVVGIDAPCRWSLTGRARPAERELMAQKIWCFSSPTFKAAQKHPKQNFHWMLAGAQLFQELETTHMLYKGGDISERETVCFETFPHAVVCALAGQVVSAKPKGASRRTMLRGLGIDETRLPNIDFVDAALCALTAIYLLKGQIKSYGEADTGMIVVPIGKNVADRNTSCTVKVSQQS